MKSAFALFAQKDPVRLDHERPFERSRSNRHGESMTWLARAVSSGSEVIR